MNPSNTVPGLTGALTLFLASTGGALQALAQQPGGAADAPSASPSAPSPAGPTAEEVREIVADPNQPEKTRILVRPEEREALGLNPHTWSGVVQPEAYTTLERLDRLVRELTEKLNKQQGSGVEDMYALWRIRFPGMVYVQVHLKDRNTESAVLSNLRASEFHVGYVFRGPAGFVGHATKEALDKLAKNPDVTGVCLDEKPMPEDPPRAARDQKLRQGAVERIGKVEADVYQALEKNADGYVFVVVFFDGIPKGMPFEQSKEVGTMLQTRLLSSLTAHEFRLRNSLGFFITGYVNSAGLAKLKDHPDVACAALDQVVELK